MSGSNQRQTANHHVMNENEFINIRSRASNNGMTTILIGALALVFALFVIGFAPASLFLLGVMLAGASVVAFVMGVYKLQEPKYSVQLGKQAIYYQHRKGTWQIPWENIQRVDVPRVSRGFEHLDLEMIGIRLREPELFLNSISPRLITHLLMEQRPLLTHVAAQNCQTGDCYGDDLIDDVKYKCADGTIINGVNAMFANRMSKLRNGLGYDVYLSVSDLDRDGDAFVSLLRECHESVK